MSNPFDKQALIGYRMQRARETLQDAHLLFEQGGSTESVVNRAYYAMLYAVLALLTLEGKGAAKHGGVIALFDLLFIKTGKIASELSKAIHKAFDLRQVGDYREMIVLDGEQTHEILQSADRFVATLDQYLRITSRNS
jgi:uncharacterized protein (UPF0332 family)